MVNSILIHYLVLLLYATQHRLVGFVLSSGGIFFSLFQHFVPYSLAPFLLLCLSATTLLWMYFNLDPSSIPQWVQSILDVFSMCLGCLLGVFWIVFKVILILFSVSFLKDLKVFSSRRFSKIGILLQKVFHLIVSSVGCIILILILFDEKSRLC